MLDYRAKGQNMTKTLLERENMKKEYREHYLIKVTGKEETWEYTGSFEECEKEHERLLREMANRPFAMNPPYYKIVH